MPDLEHSLTAWAGWALLIPKDWQFFQIEGSYGRGLLVLGDDQRPRLELSWAWVTRRRFNSERYVQKFLRRRVPKENRGQIRPVRLAGFSTAAIVETETGLIGAGFCENTCRLLHWIYHPEGREETRQFQKQLLPQWRDQPLESPVRWKFYDFDFLVPPGFRLESAELNLGSMEVVLNNPTTWRARPRVRIRYIYPSALALARQSLDKWLREILKANRAPYRIAGKTCDLSQNGGPEGALLRARLPLILRTLGRLVTWRLPAKMEASLHHLTDRQQLLYLQIADSPIRAESTRNFLLNNLNQGPLHDT